MKREAFLDDIKSWVQLARLIERYGGDKERIRVELACDLKVKELPLDLAKGLDWFISGIGR